MGHITRSYLKNKKKEQEWKERKKKENVIKMRDRRGNKECKREVIEKGRKKERMKERGNIIFIQNSTSTSPSSWINCIKTSYLKD